MAGRSFAVHNKQLPACIEQMSETVPKCFDARVWKLYLREAWREVLNRPAELAKLERGQVPDYCADCSTAYREQMAAAGNCHPPSGAEVPPLATDSSLPAIAPVSPGSAAGGLSIESAGEACMVRSNPAARVAGKVAAGVVVRQRGKQNTAASDPPDRRQAGTRELATHPGGLVPPGSATEGS